MVETSWLLTSLTSNIVTRVRIPPCPPHYMKQNISIGKVLASSFQFLGNNFNVRLKEGFPAVLLITIAFNILNYLITKDVASNFTILFFFLFTMLISSAIGICVHEEILNKNKILFFREFLSYRSFKYFLNFLLLTVLAISPIVTHLIIRKMSGGSSEHASGLLGLLWIFTMVLALKLIFILPKLTLGLNFKYNFKELNFIGSKLFILLVIVTVIFLFPSMIFLTLQLSFMTSYKDLYEVIKPLFDIGSFYISYLNYITIFAVISYAFKDYFSK